MVRYLVVLLIDSGPNRDNLVQTVKNLLFFVQNMHVECPLQVETGLKCYIPKADTLNVILYSLVSDIMTYDAA